MANQILTRQEITNKALLTLTSNLVAVPNMYRDLDQEFGKKGGKIGDTIFVRKAVRAIGVDGAEFQPEAMTDTQVPVTINQQSGVHFQMSTQEKFLSIDDFNNRYLKEYSTALSNKLDSRALAMMAANSPNLVGTPGTTPGLSGSDAFLIYATAGRILGEMGFPLKGRKRTIIINEAMRVGWIDFAKTFFNEQAAIAKQFKTGQVSNALGYDWFVDQNIATQVIGALGGTPAVNGGGQAGSSIVINGATASVNGYLNVGDQISFAGVYAVNPQTRVSTGSLQGFTVQATVNTDSGGNATIQIFPALVPAGQYQNVTTTPATGALVSVYNTAAAGQGALAGLSSPQAMLFDQEAFAFVCFPGDVPDGVDMGYEQTDEETGVAVRFIRDWIGVGPASDMWINRLETYYGMAPMLPEGSVRIAS